MVLDRIKKRFQENRKKYPSISAKNAYRYAKARSYKAYDWKPDQRQNNAVEIESSTWKIIITIEPDDFPDYSWLGKFDSNWSKDAIDHKALRGSSIGYQYFHTGNDYSDSPPAERKKYILQDYNRLCDLDEGDWYFITISAKAYLKGIELGSACVGGFESDAGQTYLDSEAHNIALEALTEAKAQLAKLRKS